MNSRTTIGIVIVFCVLLIGWLWWAGWEVDSNVTRGGISKAQYQQLKLGMSEDEVVSILGSRHSIIQEDDGVAWRWSVDWSGNGYCEVVFKDGKIVEKEATDEGVQESD